MGDQLTQEGGILVQWVTYAVCIEELTIADLVQRGAKPATVMSLLKAGLDVLGRHYGRMG